MKVAINLCGHYVFNFFGLSVFANAIRVEKEGYGVDAKYIPKPETLDIEMIQDSQVVMSEEETAAILRKKLEKAESDKSSQWLKAYNAENENKKLKEEMEKLKALCPHTEKKDDSPKPTQEEKPF